MLSKIFSSLKENKGNSYNEESNSRVGTIIESNNDKKMYYTFEYQDVATKNESSRMNFKTIDENSDILFADIFTKKGGKFVYSATKSELIEQLSKFMKVNKLTRAFVWEQELIDMFKSSISDADLVFDRQYDIASTAISMCECLVCNEGTIMINPLQNNPRPSRVFPDLQIIIASKSQLTTDIEHALFTFSKKYTEPFPFIIDVCNDVKTTRHVSNKLILNSQGTKNIFLFYCEESIV